METRNLDEIIKYLMTEYGGFVNAGRACVGLDGLKFVHRRILWSLYNIGRKKFVKAATVVGDTIGHYHPHGDSSTYSTLTAMVHNNLVTGHGNLGCITGLEPLKPAGMRYPEVKWNSQLDADFKYVKYTDMIPGELDFMEPKIIPVRFPFALLHTSDISPLEQGIGVGLKSSYPKYKYDDLKQLLQYELDARRKTSEPLDIVPHLSKHVDVISYDKTIITHGRGRITICPKISINKSKKTIVLPYMTRSIKAIIDKHKDQINVIDRSKPNATCIVITIKPYVRLNITTLHKLIKQKQTMSISISSFIAMDDKVVHSSIVDWVFSCYHYRLQCYRRMIQHNIETTMLKIDELNIIKAIKPYVSKATNMDMVKFSKLVSSKTKIPATKIKEVCNKYTISKLITMDVDISHLTKELKQLQSKYKFENAMKIVFSEY